MCDQNNVIPFCEKKRKTQANDMETVQNQQHIPNVTWDLIPEMMERIPADKLEESIKFKNKGVSPAKVFPENPELEKEERDYLAQFVKKD